MARLRGRAEVEATCWSQPLAESPCFAALLRSARATACAIALFLAYYPYARSIAEIHSCKQLAYGYIRIVLALVQFQEL